MHLFNFSLGLSWLSSKVTPAKSYTSILESLKASAFGLGEPILLFRESSFLLVINKMLFRKGRLFKTFSM